MSQPTTNQCLSRTQTETETPSTQSLTLLERCLIVCANLFNEHNMEASIFYGTLLGFYREKKVIPYDNDIDFIMDESHFDKVKALAKYLKTKKHDLQMIIRSEKGQLIKLIYRCPETGKKVKGDIFLFQREYTKKGSQAYITYEKHSFQWEHIVPFKRDVMYGVSIWVPQNIPKVLETQYGPNYMIPNPHSKGRYSVWNYVKETLMHPYQAVRYSLEDFHSHRFTKSKSQETLYKVAVFSIFSLISYLVLSRSKKLFQQRLLKK